MKNKYYEPKVPMFRFFIVFQIRMSEITIRLLDQLRESANEVILYIRGTVSVI